MRKKNAGALFMDFHISPDDRVGGQPQKKRAAAAPRRKAAAEGPHRARLQRRARLPRRRAPHPRQAGEGAEAPEGQEGPRQARAQAADPRPHAAQARLLAVPPRPLGRHRRRRGRRLLLRPAALVQHLGGARPARQHPHPRGRRPAHLQPRQDRRRGGVDPRAAALRARRLHRHRRPALLRALRRRRDGPRCRWRSRACRPARSPAAPRPSPSSSPRTSSSPPTRPSAARCRKCCSPSGSSRTTPRTTSSSSISTACSSAPTRRAASCSASRPRRRPIFGKSARNLSLGEAAILAGSLQAPSRLNPRTGDPGKVKERQTLVLQAMAREGYITDGEAQRRRDRSQPADPHQGRGRRVLRRRLGRDA